MNKTEVRDSSGRLLLAIQGRGTLLEVRDPNNYGSRTTVWEIDGERFYAFLEEPKGDESVLEEMRRVGLKGTADIVLLRGRKQRRKDGTPIPQTGPWEDLSVFDDTSTNIGSVNGVWNKNIPNVDVDFDSSVGTPASDTAPEVRSEHGTVTARTRSTDLQRLEAAVEVGVPRSVITQIAAIVILDGADPIEVRDIVRSHRHLPPAEAPAPEVRVRREVEPALVEEPATLPAPPAEAPAVVSVEVPAPTPTTSTTPIAAETAVKPSLANVGAGGHASARGGSSLPPPRRARRCIDDAQIVMLQNLADVSGVDRVNLNAWAQHLFGRGLRNISHEDATLVISEFRSMEKEEGIAAFREQVKEATASHEHD